MKKIKCGFVTIVGRPNSGKSTLMNNLLGQKISIVSRVPQTTRYIIRGILNLKDAQIVFVDTPGIHIYKHKLSSELNSMAFNSLDSVELILYVVDVGRCPREEETRIMKDLVLRETPVIMALNKTDVSNKFVNEYIEMWRELSQNKQGPLKYFLPISALKGHNLDSLLKSILEFLPKSEPFYEKDAVTDFPLNYRVSDIIREKICLLLKEELPHNMAVEIEDIQQEDNITKIMANILVAKKSQKPIVIGEKGSMIKEIGTLSRKELEGVFSKKVFLQLWVKLKKDWQDSPRILKELGYSGL